MLILQEVKPRQPESCFGVRGIETHYFLELLDGAINGCGLAGSLAGIAETAQINVAEKTARLRVLRVALQQSLGFQFGVMNTLRLPIHLRQAFANDWRLRVQRIGLFVIVDGLRSVFAA